MAFNRTVRICRPHLVLSPFNHGRAVSRGSCEDGPLSHQQPLLMKQRRRERTSSAGRKRGAAARQPIRQPEPPTKSAVVATGASAARARVRKRELTR